MLAHPWLQALAGTAVCPPRFFRPAPPPTRFEHPMTPTGHQHQCHPNGLQQVGGVGGGEPPRPRFTSRPGSSSPTAVPTSDSGSLSNCHSPSGVVSSRHHHHLPRHHHHHHHHPHLHRGTPPPPGSVSRGRTIASARAIAASNNNDSVGHLGVGVGDQSEGGGVGGRHRGTPSLVMDVCFLESEIKRLHRWSLQSKVSATKPVLQAIRCTTSNCNCDCFHPGKTQARLCENCRHGWVSHALDKLGYRQLYNCSPHAPQVELVQPSIAFDVASLMLFGTQALPIRLKILLDRLFSVLAHEDVLQVLHGFGWTYEDYARGYIIQDTAGNVLDRWILATREEEPLILQQFLRFGETKAIAQHLLLQETGVGEKLESGRPSSVPRMGHDSEIKKFIERTNRVTGSALFKHAALLAASSGLTSIPVSSGAPSTLVPTSSVNHVSSLTPLPTTSTSLTLPLSRPRPFRIPSSVSSTHSLSPPGPGSPAPNANADCRSPAPLQSSSPLNKLQNMQPRDYRRDKIIPSPDSRLLGGGMEGVVGSLISSAQHATPLSSPTSSAPTISSAHSMTGYANHYTSVTTGMSDTSATDCETDDDSGHAINLSRSSNPGGGGVTSHLHDSIYAARKVRHLRKSANPMRRRWNPIVLSTLTTNPATGKKRVQCHVCLKTFCDKGALKIHFSAVHLREMHKCTVEGCNMMFSSRRSRNRHSANPNPKLHTPNYRRKINPHDGRSANPYPLIPPTALLNLHNNNNHAMGALGPVDPDRPFVSIEEAVLVESKLTDDSKLKEELSREPSLGRDSRKSSPERLSRGSPPLLQTVDGVLALTKKPRLTGGFDEALLQHQLQIQSRLLDQNHFQQRIQHLEQQQLEQRERLMNQSRYDGEADVSNEEGMNLSLKDQSQSETPRGDNRDANVNASKGVRKRKSMNPTRCAAVTSDDDLEYVTTDDSSSDTYIDRMDENGMLNSNDDEDDDLLSSDDLGDDSKDYFYRNHLYERNINEEIPPPSKSIRDNLSRESPKSTPLASPVFQPPPPQPQPQEEPEKEINETKDEEAGPSPAKAERMDREEDETAAPPPPQNESSERNGPPNEMMEMAENPLRHLESLSLGAFANLANKSRGHFGLAPTSSGVSFHAPGLGLASSASSGGEERPRSSELVSLSNNQVSNICQNSSDHESYSEQMSLLPAFRDASLVGSLEIPVDKENPRRCTACGKIFQNHFGVKTHYQNVHLKLMHKCTVEGCNAAFPSKRSRDRHSANLNLHRKLLSTSGDSKGSPFLDKSALYPYHSAGAQLRDEFFSRLYDPQGLQPLNFSDIYPGGRLAPCNPEALVAFPNHLGPLPFHPAFMTPTSTARLSEGLMMGAAGLTMNPNAFLPGLRSGKDSPSSSLTATPSPRPLSRPHSPKSSPPTSALDDRENEGGRLSCEFCPERFRETDTLRDHYENCHARELLQKVRESRAIAAAVAEECREEQQRQKLRRDIEAAEFGEKTTTAIPTTEIKLETVEDKESCTVASSS